MGMCVVSTFFYLLAILALGAHGGRRNMRDQQDALQLARCDAKCWTLQKPLKAECVSRCLSSQQKAGWCALAGELSAWDAACVRACERDSGCPGVLKCCQHDCGATCQLPRGLHEVQGLPGIPQNVTVGERRRGRAIRVRWSFNSALESTPLLFILEERHHVGRRFTESRLGEWTPRQRSQRSDISLKNVVKPGRWYQFRVAAINENGTRGFSRPSAPFTTSHGPRPPNSPQDLMVDALRYSNGSLGGTLRWKAPISSDLPVHKYKVYWSRRLQGVDHDLDSVLVHHHTVGKDQTMFDIKDLQPRSLYFLQVQALAQFGTTRLKSEKSAIVLNTTNYSNDSVIPTEGNSSKRSADLRIEGLHLQKLYWSKDQLLASIAWRPVHLRPGKAIRYSVQWWTRQCYGVDKTYENRKHIAATTDASRFKLNDLNFGCKYLVRVSRIGEHNNSYAAEMAFKSPSCQQLQVKSKSEKIKCT